ncbi:hypothetical protein KI387_023527, partial [Taxus chinensis]
MGEEVQKQKKLPDDDTSNEQFQTRTTVSFPRNFRRNQPQQTPLKLEVEEKGGINPQNLWQ